MSNYYYNFFNYISGEAAYCPKNDSSYFIDVGPDGKLKECNDGTQVCHNGVIFRKKNNLSCFHNKNSCLLN